MFSSLASFGRRRSTPTAIATAWRCPTQATPVVPILLKSGETYISVSRVHWWDSPSATGGDVDASELRSAHVEPKEPEHEHEPLPECGSFSPSASYLSVDTADMLPWSASRSSSVAADTSHDASGLQLPTGPDKLEDGSVEPGVEGRRHRKGPRLGSLMMEAKRRKAEKLKRKAERMKKRAALDAVVLTSPKVGGTIPGVVGALGKTKVMLLARVHKGWRIGREAQGAEETLSLDRVVMALSPTLRWNEGGSWN